MGITSNKTSDKEFMTKTHSLMSHFVQQQALFHAEDIQFPLSTDQMKIVDATGRRVKLAGGNWSGGHLERQCVHGLELRPMKDIVMDIRFKLKMNCVRLTYSLQMIFNNGIILDKWITANPELKGKTVLQVFDITIKTLTDAGLMVILNNHTSKSQWCCTHKDGDGLWWNEQYPEQLFFKHVEMFAKRYKDNPRVVGIDLRNQIRKANGISPTWGDGNVKTDWRRAAEIAGEIALKEAPHWLILVGGLNYQLDFEGVRDKPIKYSVPNKLVYTGHFYAWSWPIPFWNLYSYDMFKKKIFNTQTYVRTLGFPYLLGEFGSNCQDVPWTYIMQYLKQTDVDWTYWPIDGYQCNSQLTQTFGVFQKDFCSIRHPQMLQQMINVGPPPNALADYDKYKPKDYHPESMAKKEDRMGDNKENINQNENCMLPPKHPEIQQDNQGEKDPEGINSLQKRESHQKIESNNKTETPQKIEIPEKTDIQQKKQTPQKIEIPEKTEIQQKEANDTYKETHNQ